MHILVRMGSGKAGQPGSRLVNLGVVLHRARAKRIITDVDRPIELAQAHIVPHQRELVDLRQVKLLAKHGSRGQLRLGYIQIGQGGGHAAGLAQFIDNGLGSRTAYAKVSLHDTPSSATSASASTRASISSRLTTSVTQTSIWFSRWA